MNAIFAFGWAIWVNWPTIVVTTVVSTIASFIAGRSATTQRRFGFFKSWLEWIGTNKALFTVACVFIYFLWASFSAFDTEREAKEDALNKLGATSAIVNTRVIRHGTTYHVEEFDYIIVVKSTDTPEFTVFLAAQSSGRPRR